MPGYGCSERTRPNSGTCVRQRRGSDPRMWLAFARSGSNPESAVRGPRAKPRGVCAFEALRHAVIFTLVSRRGRGSGGAGRLGVGGVPVRVEGADAVLGGVQEVGVAVLETLRVPRQPPEQCPV